MGKTSFMDGPSAAKTGTGSHIIVNTQKYIRIEEITLNRNMGILRIFTAWYVCLAYASNFTARLIFAAISSPLTHFATHMGQLRHAAGEEEKWISLYVDRASSMFL
jgi:hypothetical protein